MPKENYFAVRLEKEDAMEVQDLAKRTPFSQNQILKCAVRAGLPIVRGDLSRAMPAIVPAIVPAKKGK
jgi:hypothetical protein